MPTALAFLSSFLSRIFLIGRQSIISSIFSGVVLLRILLNYNNKLNNKITALTVQHSQYWSTDVGRLEMVFFDVVINEDNDFTSVVIHIGWVDDKVPEARVCIEVDF